MSRTRSIGKMIVGLVVVAGLLGGGAYWAMNRDQSTKSQLIKGKVERGMIRISVQATGTLEAVRTVQVGSQISGQISALHADYNSKVRKGQLLAEIDPRTFESQVLTEEAQNAAAQARLQSSQADLINQEANLVQVEANLKVAQVSHENTMLLFDRAKRLKDSGLIPQSEFDIARLNLDSSAAKVEQAQASIRQAQAQIRSRQASTEQVRSDIVGAKAQLERAQINLELTKIYSPVDGVVISRSVDIGQTVAASLSAPTLFLIANDLTRMQVKANIDEADIGKITPEVQVSFTVDAYPADTFNGQIAEVRLEPQTVQNVVTYGVIVSVENPQLKLKPGMTANLTMVVEQRDNVLTVPNAALRFTPTGMTQEEISKLLAQSPPTADALPEPPPSSPTGGAQIPPAPGAGNRGGAREGGDQGFNGARRGGRGGQGGGGEYGSASSPDAATTDAQGGAQANQGGGAGGDGQRGRGNRGGNGAGFNAGTGQGGGGNRGGANGGGFAGGNGGGRGGFAQGGRGGRGGGAVAGRRVVLWTQEGPGFKPIQARTGLNDGTRTEVTGAGVVEGLEIIVSDLSQTTTTPRQQPTTNPFAPQLPGNRGGGGFRGGF